MTYLIKNKVVAASSSAKEQKVKCQWKMHAYGTNSDQRNTALNYQTNSDQRNTALNYQTKLDC
jgi:hypothetical protein